MKQVAIIFTLIFGLFQAELKAQNDTTMATDSLVWHIYVAGRPNMHYLNAQEKVVNKWGVKVDYLFGTCTGDLDKEGKAFEKHNEAAFEFLAKEYGEDWEAILRKEVELVLGY